MAATTDMSLDDLSLSIITDCRSDTLHRTVRLEVTTCVKVLRQWRKLREDESTETAIYFIDVNNGQ